MYTHIYTLRFDLTVATEEFSLRSARVVVRKMCAASSSTRDHRYILTPYRTEVSKLLSVYRLPRTASSEGSAVILPI